MKRNKTNKLWLITMLAYILGSCFISCKDEGKELSEQEQEQLQEQEMDQEAEFWSVVGQLTDDVMPDDWRSATYEPCIGQPDGANTSVRVVVCPDAESAAAHFADLVGLTVGGTFAATTPDYTYTSPVVGTLHYQLPSGQSLAVVDVDIKQMPGLSQIVYKSPEQMGENGSFNGTAYYRFGDVVTKQNADGQTDYWICVRPCFGPESKGDSHWISFSKLPSDNVKTATKRVNGVQLNHIMPKNLCANQTHMQNTAELLYAMLFPTQWAANLSTDYKKLRYFSDFNYVRNFKYNNQYFFENVCNSWPAGMFKQIFGLTEEELRQELSQNGLNLVYSTSTMSGNNISLPVATFSGTNLKTKVLTKKTSSWATESFNIYDLTRKGYMEFSNLTGAKEKAWVVRYATGATLAKGSRENPVFDKYKRLPNCNDMFVYNQTVDRLDMSNLKNIAPKEAIYSNASNALNDGSGTYMIGDVVKDEHNNRWICIAGSPYNSMFRTITDHTACFISFDFNDVNVTGNKVSGLLNEEEALEVSRMFFHFLHTVSGSLPNDYKYDLGSQGKLGSVLNHILTWTDVDFRKIALTVDSTWTFTNPGVFHSTSSSFLYNVAYDDGTPNKQAILRNIADVTQAGTERTSCLNDFQDIRLLTYKHYQSFIPSQMRQPNADEASLSMNTWCLPWYVTSDKMYLQDVTDRVLVNFFAADDKWVTLPLKINDEYENGERRTPRTAPEATARPADYIHYNSNDTPKTHMYNEPVIFVRLMKVEDLGGKTPALMSKDGRKLTIVHLQNDKYLYSMFIQGAWAQHCNTHRENGYYIDNIDTPPPMTPGWPN